MRNLRSFTEKHDSVIELIIRGCYGRQIYT